MDETSSTITDQDLLDFISGADVETLPTKAKPLLRKFARGAAREMPPDLQDEVVSQSLEYLTRYGAQFRPERGTAASFLRLLVGQAARRVRADYCPPGQRTRLERRDRRHGDREAPSLSAFDLEITSGTWDAVGQLEAGCDIKALLGRAPVRVAEALVLIYLVGEAVSAAARAVGMSRFTLNREIARFRGSVREAMVPRPAFS